MIRRGAALLLLLAASSCKPSKPGPPYAEVRAIVDHHCISCHSEHPSEPAFPIAPKIKLDTAEEMQKSAELIKKRASVDRTMPLLNKTNMSDAERELLAAWVDAGAKINSN